LGVTRRLAGRAFCFNLLQKNAKGYSRQSLTLIWVRRNHFKIKLSQREGLMWKSFLIAPKRD
jgi:hypothetical protein